MILLKMLKIQICNFFDTKLKPDLHYVLVIFFILNQIFFCIARKDNSSIQYNCILPIITSIVSFWPSLDGLPKYCFRMRPHVHPF